MIQLSKRLQAVAHLAAGLGNIGCVADVGTDHGYIPIYLVEQGICEHAIAMDIRKGPLQRAQEHIKQYQLGDYIETRLSDGLVALGRQEAQVIVIAGMGGATMQGILEAGQAVIGPDTMLVLQPQSELLEFRRYLFRQGYRLLEEDIVEEDGKYYPMMKVQRPGQPELVPYTAGELRYGPLLLGRKHPVLREFLQWQLGQKEKLLLQLSEAAAMEQPRGIEKSGNEAAGRTAERVREITEELSMVRQTLAGWKETEVFGQNQIKEVQP